MLDLAIRGPIERADLPGLFARVCALLAASTPGERGGILRCDVTGLTADAVAVDALARLQLGARRYRCEVWLCGASDELRSLVAFMGLSDVLREGLPPRG